MPEEDTIDGTPWHDKKENSVSAEQQKFIYFIKPQRKPSCSKFKSRLGNSEIRSSSRDTLQKR